MLTPLMQIHAGLKKLREANGLDQLSMTIESGNGKICNSCDVQTSAVLCGHIVHGGRNFVKSVRIFTDEALAPNCKLIPLVIVEMKKEIDHEIEEWEKTNGD